jgi:hypothetical protein
MVANPELVAAGAEEGGPPAEDNREFAVVGRARDALQADLLTDWLEENGIDAFVDADREGMVEKLSSPAEGFPVKAPRRELERAQALFDERKAALEADPDAAAKAAEDEEEAERAAGR